MKFPDRRQFLHLAAGAAGLPVVSRMARAQAYPTRPITMIGNRMAFPAILVPIPTSASARCRPFPCTEHRCRLTIGLPPIPISGLRRDH
jgi:hypothetical protein